MGYEGKSISQRNPTLPTDLKENGHSCSSCLVPFGSFRPQFTNRMWTGTTCPRPPDSPVRRVGIVFPPVATCGRNSNSSTWIRLGRVGRGTEGRFSVLHDDFQSIQVFVKQFSCWAIAPLRMIKVGSNIRIGRTIRGRAIRSLLRIQGSLLEPIWNGLYEPTAKVLLADSSEFSCTKDRHRSPGLPPSRTPTRGGWQKPQRHASLPAAPPSE